jgi:hypothetical protein
MVKQKTAVWSAGKRPTPILSKLFKGWNNIWEGQGTTWGFEELVVKRRWNVVC